MRSQLRIGVSLAALAAAAVVGGAASAQTDGGAPAGDYNTENGVHAAPSGHVTAARLEPVGSAVKPVRAVRVFATPAHASAHAARVEKAAARSASSPLARSPSSSLQWLTLRVASAPTAAVAATPAMERAAAAAPTPETAPLLVAAPAQAEVQPPAPAPAPQPAMQVAEAAPSAPPVEAVSAEPEPQAAPSAAADPAPAAIEALASAAPDSATSAAPALAARPAVADALEAPPAGGSEEDAVYRRSPPAPAPDPAASDQAARDQAPPSSAAEPQLERIRDERPTDPPMAQHVAFPRHAVEAASAFDRYMRTVAAIDATFSSGASVVQAMEKAEAYDPRQLEEGMIAYGAIAAMQSPRFVYGVMDLAADGRRREALAAELMADPEAAARLPGAADAAALASAALLNEARPVVVAGRAIKQASYDVQHQSWSVLKATDQPRRLAHAKALSSSPIPAREGDVAQLLRQISTVDLDASQADRRVSPLAAHSLALAAVAILSDTGPGQDSLAQVLAEKLSADCLKLAKLNLFQCLSVAGPEYEDVFCLGQHAVLDTAQCVAGGAAPAGEAVASDAPVAYARAGE